VRRDRIDRLAALTLENADEFTHAMSQDFGNRSIHAATVSDILGSITDVALIRRNLKKWMKPRDIMPAMRAMGVRTRGSGAAPWRGRRGSSVELSGAVAYPTCHGRVRGR